MAMPPLGFRVNCASVKHFIVLEDTWGHDHRLARAKHKQPWSRGLWNPFPSKLIPLSLNIFVLLLNKCSRQLPSTLWLVYVTLVPLGSTLHDNVFSIKADTLTHIPWSLAGSFSFHFQNKVENVINK